MKGKVLSKSAFVLLIVIFTLSSVFAQGRIEDYERADQLRSKVNGLVYNSEVRPNWIDDSNRFWYMNNIQEGKEFILVDADSRDKERAFDHEKLARSLSETSGNDYTGFTLPFNSFEFVDEEKSIQFVLNNEVWKCDLSSYKCTNTGQSPPARRRGGTRGGITQQQQRPEAVTSPDGKWEAFTKNFNVYIRSVETEDEFQLSLDGAPSHYYSDSFAWSPDSRKLATNKTRPGYERLVHYVESSPEDQLQPNHNTRVYAKPGDVLTINKPALFNIDSKSQLPVSDELFENPYRNSRISWWDDSRAFTFEFNQRGHQVYRVIEVDGETGNVRALINEECETFFDYNHKKYRNNINDGDEIIWASEQDGWNHLYLYDGITGRVKNQITKGEWVMRGVDRVDIDSRQIWFTASGREPGQDPYLIHYYRIGFDGSGLVKLTEGNGNHSVNFSPSRKYFVDTWSRVDEPPVSVLRNAADGKKVMDLEKTDISKLLESGWKMPEVFTSKARDGVTDIWGIIIRPTNFDESKIYPVIEYIYAGPHSSFVPKTFRAYQSMMAMAELGFILVQIDGMGTSNRSKAFHDVAWKNLGDAGFPDRILWMKDAANKYPYMDISRVGIYGTSAGGQSSMGGLLFHPDFYKVAVSACGCHDNRMDKIWWNELWMSWPIGEHYSRASNVDNAHLLEGKLLLILGEMDTNVDPSSTMQVVDALIKANKDFDFLYVPGMGHSGGGSYGEHKRRDFFVKHLLGINPPEWK
ncbi:DPP IV N-terminal domain-containing protein [candidate division KSB1 bacterium]